MKTLTIMLLALGSTSLLMSAETKVTLSGVHLCCKGCVNGVTKAVEQSGGKATCDAKAGTVVISGVKGTVEKALESVAKAGYYGKSDYDALSISCKGGTSDKKVKSLTLGGAHLCCGKCIKAVAKAVSATEGANTHTAKKGSKTFEVTGNFNARAFINALHDNGLHAFVM
jgi:periplasmic mercuric ion binding protein